MIRTFKIWNILFFVPFGSLLAADYSVYEFGATGNGKNLDTEYIQKAIDAASIKGGEVIFPSGTYLSGTIYLKSNVTLKLDEGATLLGSSDLTQYPENLPDYNFFRKGIIKRALIYAENLENVAIKGEGTIDGQGYAFKEPENKDVSSYSVRPYVIWMVRCKKVRIEGIKLQNSALWMQHYLGCENLRISGIEVFNHSNKNNDMMDIDGCRDVIISDCRGDTDDDGITLKSTHAKPNENITITNCIISSHCNAIKCGTESNAGFKNITISNCIIRPSEDREVIYGKPNGISGISLEVVDGAEMNGINISNIIMDGPAVPLFIRLGNRARGYDNSLAKPGIGSIENIRISNIMAFNALTYGSSISGIPGHPVKNISLDNIRIFYSGGGTKAEAEKVVNENESSYPEATMFGNLPVYGMFIRHAENINFSKIQFHLEGEDARSPIWVEDVKSIHIEDVRADINSDVSFIQAMDVSDLYLRNLIPSNPCHTAIRIAGDSARSIRLTGVDQNLFTQFYVLEGNTDPTEIKVMNIFE